MPPEPLESKQLRLVPPHASFADDVYAYGSDPEFCRYIDAAPMQSHEDARAFLDALAEDNAAERRMYWVAVDRAQGRAIGTLGLLFPFARRHGVAEFGYGFARSSWGSGAFQEAGRTVIDFAFGRLGLARLQAITRCENVAAIRGVEKLGFRREATLRSFYQATGRRIDAALLVLLADGRRPEGLTQG
jgi:[ribosomal protein S5]-alanine N-acetyltransferase